MKIRLLVLSSLAACSADMTEITLDIAPESADQRELDGASSLLGFGDSGPEVQAATQYFTRYGYFENEELRKKHPWWQPIVGQAPADDAVFGEELEGAVRAFQARGGLPVTGAIDDATREHMELPRCGVPDSSRSMRASGAGPIDKWATARVDGVDNWQPDSNVTFTYDDSDVPAGGIGQLSRTDIRNTLDAAMAHSWSQVSNVTFEEVPAGSPRDVAIKFRDWPEPEILGRTYLFAGSLYLEFDISHAWDDLVSHDAHDFYSLAIHELGHVIGFDHSTIGCTNGNPVGPVMCGGLSEGEDAFSFQPDDYQAVAVSPYVAEQAPGNVFADDIGASVVNNTEYVWRIAGSAENFAVSRWTGSAWAAPPGGGVGARIDVAGRVPWVVTNNGLVMQRAGVTAQSPAGTSWTNRGDCDFLDIGANASGVIWALGGQADAAGNYALHRHANASGTGCNTATHWTLAPSSGLRGRFVDVAPDGSPWVIRANGVIRKGNPAGSSFETIPGGAKDVAVAAEAFGVYGAVWITSPSLNIYTLNRQDAGPGGVPPARDEWFPFANGGQGQFITVGRFGLPWFVGGSGKVWRRVKTQ